MYSPMVTQCSASILSMYLHISEANRLAWQESQSRWRSKWEGGLCTWIYGPRGHLKRGYKLSPCAQDELLAEVHFEEINRIGEGGGTMSSSTQPSQTRFRERSVVAGLPILIQSTTRPCSQSLARPLSITGFPLLETLRAPMMILPVEAVLVMCSPPKLWRRGEAVGYFWSRAR